MFDERNYTVVGINGFRWDNLRREEAFALAQCMREQMAEAGWVGQVRVFYRDGVEVKAR